MMLCALLGIYATALSEGFEGTTFPPADWSLYNGGDANTWVRSTSAYHTGTYGASITYGSTAHNDYLITPKLSVSASNHTISFWAKSYSSSYLEHFKVLLSTTDNVNTSFTTTLAADVTAPYAWTQYTYDLSTPTNFIGQNVYIAVVATSTDMYYLYLDDFTGPDVYVANDPEPTNHVTSFAAGTLNYTSIQLNWTGSTGAQLPVKYLIQAIKTGVGSYVAVADGTPVADDAVWTDNNAAINVAHVVGANTYTFTGLSANTAYSFKIWPYTNSGTNINFKTDGTIPTVNASTLDPTITSFPWVVDFGTTGATFPPANWSILAGLYPTETPATTTGYWASDDFCNLVTTPVNYSARLNIWTTSTKYWLVTPPLAIPATGYELRFNLGLTTYSGVNVAPTPGAQADDKFIVLISDSPMMTAPTVLRQWDNTGSAFVYDTISPTGENHTISLAGISGTKYIAFYGESTVAGGDNNIYVDNVTVQQTPVAGVLSVNPNPITFGAVSVGATKTIPVTLSNVGGANFNVTSISLTNHSVFTIPSPPSLPYTIAPGGTPLTFNVLYTPTGTAGDTDVLNISDSRANTAVNVTGTGVIGDVCEYPYLASLPVVDYNGTTAGYNNDYTSAMFTGLGSTYYVGGKDWVAKVTIPEAGWLDVSLADQAGYSSQYMGVFLVNTIPSVATPATVLAQAYAGSGAVSITDAVVSPGVYYVIVDNWPSPADIYFVMNMSFEALPSGPVLAPNLDYPTDGAPGMLQAGFPFQFSWNMGGSEPDEYNLYVAAVDDLSESYTSDEFFSVATPYYNVTSPYTPAFTYTYDAHYVWTVGAYNSAYPDEVFTWPPHEFIIQSDPSITVFPYTQTFGETTFPPALWALYTTGTYAWTRNAAVNGYGATENMGAARANFYSQSSATPYDLITAPINLHGMAGTLTFDHAYATYSGENDQLEVLYSTNGTDYTSLQVYNGGAAGPLNTGGTTTDVFVPTADQWATKTLNLPLGTTNVKFRAISAYGNDLYIDNIGIDQRVVPAHDIAVTAVGGFPASALVGTSYTPTVTLSNLGSSTETFDVNLTIVAYNNTQTVTSLAPGATTTVSFPFIIPGAEGPFPYTASAPLTGDANLADNTLSGSFNAFESLWVNKAACPVGSYLGSAASYIDGSGNGHIITSGGNTTLYTEVYDYNVNANTWSLLTNLPGQRRVHASAIVDNYLYAIGGSDASSVYQSTNYRYDLVGAGGWTTMSPLPVALGWVKAVPYQNYIYVAGGVDAASTVVSSVYLYNTATDTWTTATSLPGVIFGGAFTITGNTLVYVAGADISVISSAVYAGQINPSDPTLITWSTRASYPGISSSASGSSADLLALVAGPKTNKGIATRDYPAGTMYRIDGGTWGDDAILVANGSPGTAWTPATPCPAYVYKPSTDTWTLCPDLNTPVLGAYVNTVRSTPTTWNAVVASGYTGSSVVYDTQVLSKTISSVALPTPMVTITEAGGTITLNWAAVPGAAGGYRIQRSNSPSGPWTDSVTVGTNSWSGAASTMKFFRVIALP